MFTELLFLRFLTILKHHFGRTLAHLREPHPAGASRACCYGRCKNLHSVRRERERERVAFIPNQQS